MSASGCLDDLSTRLSTNLRCLSDKNRRISFVSLLITFWHNVLHLAVGFEQHSLDLAKQFHSKHKTNASPWKMQAFGRFMKEMHDNRHKASFQRVADVPTNNGFLLMPFLMTMRFDKWFDSAMYDVNCALQLMIRFESLYIPESRRRYATEKLLPETMAMQTLLRQIWHKILCCYSMVFNNAFAFCLSSLLSADYKITWQKHIVKEVITVAGSLLLPTIRSSGIRVFSHNGGTFEETTWILLSMKHEETGVVRMIQCTLTQNNTFCHLYYKNLLPFVILPPFPIINDEFSQVVSSQDTLTTQMIKYSICSTIVKTAILWNDNKNPPDKCSIHRVDRLEEMTEIRHRLQDLYNLMTTGAKMIAKLESELQVAVLEASKKAISQQQLVEYAETAQKQVSNDCTLIANLANNTCAMFSLLNAISSFNILNE